MGTLTKTGSGIPLNLVGVAIDNVSFVSLTIALTMSLNEAAGPYSVPPMLSTITFDNPVDDMFLLLDILLLKIILPLFPSKQSKLL